MHMLGEPRTMQSDPRYEDVVDEVRAFLEARLEFAVGEGVDEERIMLDPGIGFGKTLEHNLLLLRRLDELCALGRPLVIGTSRKAFLGRILASAAGESEPAAPARRLPGTIATNVLALERGASVLRVHDVAAVGGCPGRGCCYVGRAMGDDADELDEDDDGELDDEHEHTAESVTIEITGLSLYTHHGVSDAEREVGQRLVLDLRLDLGETDATVTDSIEDTVDYAEVCQLVALVAQQRSHRTLERLCSTIADRLLADYELEGVWVKAAKPEPPIALSVDEVSVEVWREAEG